MKRAPVVIGSTATGLALVLSFHTHTGKLTHLATGSSSTTNGGSSPTTTPTTPTTPTTNGTPSQNGTSTSTTAPSATRSATGTDVQYRYGDIQLKVTEDGSKITDIEVVQEGATDGRSYQINSQAVPILQSEAMSAQSAQIDGVSGATYTSQAYAQALQSAIDQLPT